MKSQDNCLFTLNPHHAMIGSFFSLSTLCKPALTDVPAFTIWYCCIRSVSDPQLDVQKASYFLRSTLVDQLYAKGVYFSSFLTKSNQACTKFHPNAFKNFYRTVTHEHGFSRSQINPFCNRPTSSTHQQLKHYKLQKEQNYVFCLSHYVVFNKVYAPCPARKRSGSYAVKNWRASH